MDGVSEGGTEQQKRRQTVVLDSLVERRLCRDGIHYLL
mgnify:CR=1 FL=1